MEKLFRISIMGYLCLLLQTLASAQPFPITILQLDTKQEYVLITNEGETAINLKDWTLHDHDYGKGQVYSHTFTEMFLEPGDILHMQSGKPHEKHREATHDHEKCTRYIRWAERNVWNNDCDIAYILDVQGELIAEKHSGKDIEKGKREHCK